MHAQAHSRHRMLFPASAAPPRCVWPTAGQHVYAGVRNPADGEQLARSAAGGELTPLILDVTDTSHIAAAVAAVTGHAGRAGLHGLVNNAGFGLACPTELVQLEAFRRQLEVNVTGQLAVTQAFLPSLRRARGPHRDGQHDRGPLHPALRRPAGCDQGRARRPGGHIAPGTGSMGNPGRAHRAGQHQQRRRRQGIPRCRRGHGRGGAAGPRPV